ncbi:hypothetical protein [Arsenicicoccus dermatophilus]|uniref:phage tail tube protein n=1 Tax=Arsenicicoccus dermatophilus TaxID=1076331 RepID=UPI001F4C89B2|nr:hypothetical protein [Arsenicicoccus dermatophilus]MCH8613472.1 hypothetical protein [Arsenicicoccus dermatophilus]
MPKSLADGHIKLTALTTPPKDWKAATLAELNAGLDISCRVLSGDYKLGATESDTVDEKALCQDGNVKVPTVSNYEANLILFRYFDPATGKAETAAVDNVGDGAYQMMKLKGTTVYLVQRFTSKKSTEPWASGDEYRIFEVLTDNPVDQPAEGYIKAQVPVLVQNAELNGVVAGATP